MYNTSGTTYSVMKGTTLRMLTDVEASSQHLKSAYGSHLLPSRQTALQHAVVTDELILFNYWR